MSRRFMVVVELDDDGEASYQRTALAGRSRRVTSVSTQGHIVDVLDTDANAVIQTRAVDPDSARALAAFLAGDDVDEPELGPSFG